MGRWYQSIQYQKVFGVPYRVRNLILVAPQSKFIGKFCLDNLNVTNWTLSAARKSKLLFKHCSAVAGSVYIFEKYLSLRKGAKWAKIVAKTRPSIRSKSKLTIHRVAGAFSVQTFCRSDSKIPFIHFNKTDSDSLYIFDGATEQFPFFNALGKTRHLYVWSRKSVQDCSIKVNKNA